MPIIESKSGYQYAYRLPTKSHKRMPLFVKFLLVILCLAVIGFCGYFVALKLPKYLGINSSVLTKKQSVYYLYCGEFESLDQANVFSGQIKNQGGAGFIKKNNGIYLVCLGAYKNLEDAQKVAENLIDNNVETQILAVELKAISMNKSFDKQNKELLKNALNSFYNSYECLYNLSINYDNKTFSKIEVLDELERWLEKIKLIEKDFASNLLDSNNASLVYIKIFISQLIDNLQDLVSKEANFSAEIKYSYINCIELFLSLRQEIES